jgi:hypothetical protein
MNPWRAIPISLLIALICVVITVGKWWLEVAASIAIGAAILILGPMTEWASEWYGAKTREWDRRHAPEDGSTSPGEGDSR